MKLTKVNILIVTGLILVSTLLGGCSTGQNQTLGAQTIKELNLQEAENLINNDDNLTVIDVRTPQEYATGHLPQSINLDLRSQTFNEELGKLDKNKAYLVYCQSGNRSQKALDTMKELGFKEVYNLSGGITQWGVNSLPIVK